ncbi:hypothetical protein Tco_0689752 [Tanacetum coccineum]
MHESTSRMDQLPLQIMQMMYCFINNIHVDYAELLWEGLYYSLHHPTFLIPYPIFTNIIVSHYMTIFPKISRRARDMYHNLQDDDIMKNIFNSGRHKDKDGMQISDWMITEEMKHTEHYRMYAEVFGLDVPLTQSQPTESTQGTHRTPSAPRSTCLTPPALVPTVDKADEMILQDTLQVSLAEHKIQEEQEASENVELVNKYLASREIEKMVEGSENELQGRYTYLFEDLKERFLSRKSFDTLADHLQEVMAESLPIMVDTHIKEQVKKKVPEHVRDQVPVYVMEGLIMERQKTKEEMEQTIAKAILQERGNIQAEISSQIQKAIIIIFLLKITISTVSFHEKQSLVAATRHSIMADNPRLQQQDITIWLALQMKFENLKVQQTTCRPSAVRPRDQDDPHDDAHPKGENSAKRQKTSEYEAYVSGEPSSGQVNKEERGPSTLGNQEQEDDFDFWTDSYASDDDEIPSKQVSQDIIEEVSLTIDEAKLKKMADEMLRQRCTSGDEHQYHIDQMKNLLQSDIV